jgi:predicted RNase H-like HicB family nuclease
VKSFTIIIEHCPETRLYVGYVPGFPGAHSQGETLDELRENIREVIAMLLEDGIARDYATLAGKGEAVL